MKTIHQCVLASTLAILSPGSITFIAYSSGKSRPKYQSVPANSATKARHATDVKQFKGYTKWIRVNPKPIFLNPQLAALCAIASPQQTKLAGKDNPHLRKYFTVYVNAVGRNAMLTATKPVFPVGSIIIKQKLASKDSKTPELLTVMVKHPRGYDNANGNWEYLVLNGAASKIQGRGALANCQSCHADQKDTDYVFRSYLPNDPASNVNMY